MLLSLRLPSSIATCTVDILWPNTGKSFYWKSTNSRKEFTERGFHSHRFKQIKAKKLLTLITYKLSWIKLFKWKIKTTPIPISFSMANWWGKWCLALIHQEHYGLSTSSPLIWGKGVFISFSFCPRLSEVHTGVTRNYMGYADHIWAVVARLITKGRKS